MQATQKLPCGHPFLTPSCAWCKLSTDQRYGAMFGAKPATVSPVAPCAYLGGPTGWTTPCRTCTGRVELKLMHCQKHERCTLGKKVEGVACCKGCPDHTGLLSVAAPLPPAHRFTTRDVLYHVYPLPGDAGLVWRQRLMMLLRRAHLFNGRKVVSCMTGPRLEPPSAVRELAAPSGFEVVEIENDPNLREAKTLIELLPFFETGDPHRALFFGHAKGVTRPDDAGNACHPWAALCHEISLDYWPLVESRLNDHPIVGPFKKVGRAFQGSQSAWHYSGSFYWQRSADLFGRRTWREIEKKWYAAESQVGVWYEAKEAGCLFHEAGMAKMDLYRMEYLKDVLCEYVAWRAAHEGMRTTQEAAS